jgi:4-amino-4-deoxy-L-arabinose transferase-like glycosyltransferase
MISALLLYRLGRRMFSPAVGFLAALILVSSVQVCVLAHAATPDAVLLAALLITFTLFWDGYASGGRRWLWITGIGCGLAALAKGPIGLLLPVAIVSYFLLAQRQLHRLWDARLLGGVALFVLVAGPWYALVGVETRGAFLRAFWQNDNVNRFLAPMEGHHGPLWFYLATVPIGLIPWCVFLIPVIWDTIQSLRNRNESFDGARPDETAAVRFLVSWAAVYVAFFSLAQTKLPNYVLPVFAPLALLTARYLERWRTGLARVPQLQMRMSLVLLGVVGVGIAALVLVASGLLLPQAIGVRAMPELARWAALGAIPIIAATLAWRYLRRERRSAVLAVLAASAVLLLTSIASGPISVVEGFKAPKALVDRAGACRPSDEIRIAAFGYFQPSMVFYCQREVTELRTPPEAVDFLRGPLPSYLICPTALIAQLQTVYPDLAILDIRRDFYKGWEVCIVSNGRSSQTPSEPLARSKADRTPGDADSDSNRAKMR